MNKFEANYFINKGVELISLIVTYPMDEGKAMDVVDLDFGKVFDTVSLSVLLEKLTAHGMGGCTLQWVKNSGWPSPESGAEWSYVQLEAGH